MHWHHIVPKYAGGDDSPENLVHLTIEDHAIAHFVRWKMFKDHRDLWAYQVLFGLIDGEEFRRKGCRTTQKRLLKEGRHNFQLNNDAHTPEGRKRRSDRMKGNKLGALRKITPEYRAIQAEGARGNTNVRGRIWIVNDTTGERRRVDANITIPKGFRKGYKLNAAA